MNKQTRASLTKLAERCGSIQDSIEELKAEIEDIKDAEQEKYDNMPESLQNGEKGEVMQSAIDTLEGIIDKLEQASTETTDAMDELNGIAEN